MTTPQYIEAFEKYRMRVFNFVNKIVQCREDAEDITSTVFIKLWEHIDKIGLKSLEPWLMITAKTTSFDYLKSANNYHARITSYSEPENDLYDINTEVLQYIHKLVNSLSPQQQEIFKLKFYQEKDIKEISALLNLAHQTVSNVLYNSMGKIRQELKKRGIAHA